MGKQDSDKLYVCCPICSARLLQAEYVKNGHTKCENCKQFIGFSVENGKVTVYVMPKKQDEVPT